MCDCSPEKQEEEEESVRDLGHKRFPPPLSSPPLFSLFSSVEKKARQKLWENEMKCVTLRLPQLLLPLFFSFLSF